jgi:hypothetical protein
MLMLVSVNASSNHASTILTNSRNQDSTVITNSPTETDAPPQSNAITTGYYKGILFLYKYRTLDVHFDAVRNTTQIHSNYHVMVIKMVAFGI